MNARKSIRRIRVRAERGLRRKDATRSEREAVPYPKRGASAFVALTIALAALALMCLAPQSAGANATDGADEANDNGASTAKTARVIYHFVNDIDSIDVQSWSDYQDMESVFVYTEQEESDDAVRIGANHHPDLIDVSTEPMRWRVVENYASNSSIPSGAPVDVTDQASYDTDTGMVSLPAEFAGRDLTVVFYLNAEYAEVELPLSIDVSKTIAGKTTHATLETTAYATQPTINLKLFDDTTEADRASEVSIIQSCAQIDQYAYANGSIYAVASPLGGNILMSVSDGSEASGEAEAEADADAEVALNEDAQSQASLASEEGIVALSDDSIPYVGRRYQLCANAWGEVAFVRTCTSGSNMAAITGWPEKSGTYGFTVSFYDCCDLENITLADMNHVATGGTLRTDNGGVYDYSFIAGWNFAWAECVGDVDDNGTGEPVATGGYVDVVGIDYATGTVTCSFYLACVSDIDGHDMQDVQGTFQIHQDLGGWIALEKSSANEAITEGNACYSLEGAEYTVYSDSACTNSTTTLTTGSDGKVTSEILAPGTYYVKETEAPLGYALDGDVREVTVSGGQTSSIAVLDVPQNNPLDVLLGKVDAESGSASPQGNATLEGAQFTIKYYDAFGDGAASDENLQATWILATDENGCIRFGSLDESQVISTSGHGFYENSGGERTLPLGTYTIQETKAPTGYLVDDAVYTRTVTSKGSAEAVNTFSALTGNSAIAEQVMRGGLSLEKRDLESSLLTPLGGASLDGTVFEITTLSSNDVRVGGQWHSTGEVVATLTVKDGKASTADNALPYGTYSVREVQAGTGYLLTDGKAREFSISREGQIVSYDSEAAFFDQVKRGDYSFVKRNEDTMAALAGIPFLVTSETTGESHVIVSDENGYVSTAASWNAHTSKTNANDTALSDDGTIDESKLDAEAGIWFGQNPSGLITEADDSLGALPYDTYTLEELRCSANESLELVKVEHITIKRNGVEVDGGTVDDASGKAPYIATSAIDADDGDKVVYADVESEIVDHVDYMNLDIGETYTLTATLFSKATGELVEGATGSTTFTATGINGYAEVHIPVNLAGYDAQDVVVFEELSRDGEVIAEHEDEGDSEQTLKIVPPEIGTSASDAIDSDKFVVADEQATVIDEVSYQNLVPGKLYTLSGTLHIKGADGTDGGILADADDNAVTASVEFTPDGPNGTVEVSFTFDASLLTGSELVAFESLSRGDFEITAHADIADEAQTVTVVPTGIGTTATDALDGDKHVAVDEEAAIVDKVSYTGAIEGADYTMAGILVDKATGLPLLFGEGAEAIGPERLQAFCDALAAACSMAAADADNEAETAPPHLIDAEAMEAAMTEYADVAACTNIQTTSFTPETSDGFIEMVFTVDSRNVASTDVVVYEFLVKGSRIVAEHADLSDEDQTVTIAQPAICTEATDSTDGDHYFLPSKTTTIVDTVSYSDLIPGKEYRLQAQLVNKATGKTLIANGEEVTGSTTFIPNDGAGTIEVAFEFNSAGLSDGDELVAFEYLYKSGIEDAIAEHADLDDESQTITMSREGSTPTTSVKTADSLRAIMLVAALGTAALGIAALARRLHRKGIKAAIRQRL